MATGWPADERVAAYAFVSSVPAYMEGCNPNLSLADKIRDVILASQGACSSPSPPPCCATVCAGAVRPLVILKAIEGRIARPLRRGM
jgi:hypothetical protein